MCAPSISSLLPYWVPLLARLRFHRIPRRATESRDDRGGARERANTQDDRDVVSGIPRSGDGNAANKEK